MNIKNFVNCTLSLSHRLPQSPNWTRSFSRLRTRCGSWWRSLSMWWPWSSTSWTASAPSAASSWPRTTTRRRMPSTCPVPCGSPGGSCSTAALAKVRGKVLVLSWKNHFLIPLIFLIDVDNIISKFIEIPVLTCWQAPPGVSVPGS